MYIQCKPKFFDPVQWPPISSVVLITNVGVGSFID